ncbi:MAG: peroxidase family protein [Xenococcaceae cyanobacterium]
MARHGYIPLGGDNPPSSTYHDQGKFGRIFPTLPPFAADTPTLRAALKEIGKLGGIMDAKDRLTPKDPLNPTAPTIKFKDIPKALILDANLRLENADNPELTAGITFLGQFLDHDMTFDPTSSLERQQDPETIANFRTPTLALDNLYGSGPTASPHLYDQKIDGGLTSFLIEKIEGSEAFSRDGKPRFDLPRNSQNIALIGDPRNDENLIVSQLHLGFLRFHNAIVERVKQKTGLKNPMEVFAEAQRWVRWHYQWIIVHEFLPKTVGKEMVQDILTNGRKFYKWRNLPFIPVEFAVSAYRFGHSQVRPSYRAHFGPKPDNSEAFFALFLDEGRPSNPDPSNPDLSDPGSPKPDAEDPDDLRGGKRAARRFIDWQTFFDFEGNTVPPATKLVRPNKKIDTKLSTALFDLPGIPGMEPQSLAQRNLLRHLTFRLPSGQSVAKAMGVVPLTSDHLADLKPSGLDTRTPLWFYVLREAELLGVGEKGTGGARLGPVGGRIVAEVFIGLLQGDPLSYLRQDPLWEPNLMNSSRKFEMTDLLKFAGVVVNL